MDIQNMMEYALLTTSSEDILYWKCVAFKQLLVWLLDTAVCSSRGIIYGLTSTLIMQGSLSLGTQGGSDVNGGIEV